LAPYNFLIKNGGALFKKVSGEGVTPWETPSPIKDPIFFLSLEREKEGFKKKLKNFLFS
jgi:hypothetical protein